MSVTIRSAVPADAARLSAFARRAFAETFAADNTPADMAAYLDAAFTPERQAAELRAPDAAILLAETIEAARDDGARAIAGYAHLVFGGDAPPGVALGAAPVELKRPSSACSSAPRPNSSVRSASQRPAADAKNSADFVRRPASTPSMRCRSCRAATVSATSSRTSCQRRRDAAGSGAAR